MKIYHLAVRDDYDGDPYDKEAAYYISPYSDVQGFVLTAIDELDARSMAKAYAEEHQDGGVWWLNPAVTDCTEVSPDGPPRIILADTPTG